MNEKQLNRTKHKRSQRQRGKNKNYRPDEENKERQEREPEIEEETRRSADNRQIRGEGHSSSADRKEESAQIKSQNEKRKDEEPSAEETGTFRRRKIVSNWKKYEEVEERILGDRARGADYEQLINAGSGGSMFRFKHELEWEKDVHLYAQEIFSLDVADLSQAVKCVSLLRRLNVDQSEFPMKVLSKLDNAAHKNLVEYMRNKRIQGANEISVEMKPFEEEDLEDEDELSPAKKSAEKILDILKSEIVKPIDSAQHDSDSSDNLEDDLDKLLQNDNESSEKEEKEIIPTPEKKIMDKKPDQIQLFPETNPENLEDWLDTLLE